MKLLDKTEVQIRTPIRPDSKTYHDQYIISVYDYDLFISLFIKKWYDKVSSMMQSEEWCKMQDPIFGLILKIRPNSGLILKTRPNACCHLKNSRKLDLRPEFGLRTKSDLFY